MSILDRPVSYAIRGHIDDVNSSRAGPQAGRLLPLHADANQLDIPVMTPR